MFFTLNICCTQSEKMCPVHSSTPYHFFASFFTFMNSSIPNCSFKLYCLNLFMSKQLRSFSLRTAVFELWLILIIKIPGPMYMPPSSFSVRQSKKSHCPVFTLFKLSDGFTPLLRTISWLPNPTPTAAHHPIVRESICYHLYGHPLDHPKVHRCTSSGSPESDIIAPEIVPLYPWSSPWVSNALLSPPAVITPRTSPPLGRSNRHLVV